MEKSAKVVYESSIHDLENQVAELIDSGYAPSGNIAVDPQNGYFMMLMLKIQPVIQTGVETAMETVAANR